MSIQKDFFIFIRDFDQLVSRLESERVVKEALHFFQNRLGFLRVSITLLTPDGSSLKPMVIEPEPAGIKIPALIPCDQTHLGEVVNTRQAIYRPDVSRYRNRYDIDDRLMEWGVKSDIALLLIVEDKPIGTLNCGSAVIDGISEVDRQLLTLLAPRLAYALHSSRMLEQTRRSEQKYQDIFNHSPAAIFTVSPDLEILDVNPAGQSLLGYTRDELLGRSVYDFDTDAEQVRLISREIFAGGGQVKRESQLHRKDGKVISVLNNTTVLLDERGIPFGAQCTLIDVTEQRQAVESTRIMHQLAQDALTSRKLDNILKLFTKAAIRIAGMDAGGIYLIDETTGDLHLKYTEGLSAELVEQINHYDAKSLNTRIVNEGKLLCVSRSEVKALMPQYLLAEGFRCYAALPFKVDGKVAGCINVASNMLEEINPSLHEPLGALSVQIGGILGRIRLYEDQQRNEARYRNLIASMRDGAISVDEKGRIIGINPAAGQILGYSDHQELIGRYAVEIFVDPEEHIRILHRLQVDSYVGDLDIQVRCKDGGACAILASATTDRPLRKNQQQMNFFFSDISKRMQAEAALRESEEKYRTIAYFNYDWEYWVDREGNFRYVSPSVERITGYSPVEFVSDPELLKKIIHPDDRAKVLMHKHKRSRTGEMMPLLFRIITRTGTERWISHHCQTVIDSRGEDRGRRGSNRDVTEQVKAEKALRVSEERFRKLAELSPETIVETDLRGKPLFINRRGYEILGYSEQDIAATESIESFVVPADRQRVAANVARLYEGESQPGTEYTALRKDGSTFPAVVYANVIIREGQPAGIRAIVVDITRQKALEERLRQSHKLEGIGQLAGGIAHDFNNILTAINGYTEMTLKRLDRENDSRTYRDLQLVLDAGRRAEELVRHLLAFSRKQMIQPIVLDVIKTITNLQKMLRRTIDRKIEIRLELAEDTPYISADPVQLEQIIVNLVVNARDAIELNSGTESVKKIIITTGATRVTSISLEQEECPPGDYLLLRVTDSGVGMDEPTLNHVFEPFYTTKAVGKGTGLGLSTVYGIVKQNGGSIIATSNPGKGATFEIRWPAVAPDIPLATARRKQEKGVSGAGTILVVEDDDSVREIATTRLQECGYRVVAASNGREALDLITADKLKLDLLITDMIMPEMNGAELVGRLQKLLPPFKLLYISGYTDNQCIRPDTQEGGVNFLPKPFTGDDLARKVQTILDEENR